MRVLALIIAAIAVLALGACGGPGAADQPPTIHYSRDTCLRCEMIISEARFASGLVAPSGNQRIFDDAGEMIEVIQQEGLNGQRVWVHDYQTSAWLDGTKAFYVAPQDVVTPMGSGLVAFGTRSAAEPFAQVHPATVMTWDEVLKNWTMPAMH